LEATHLGEKGKRLSPPFFIAFGFHLAVHPYLNSAVHISIILKESFIISAVFLAKIGLTVGGPVASVSRSRFFRSFFAFLFIGAALFVGWLAMWLLIGAATEHGSVEGKILSIGLGLLLLLFAVVLMVGIIFWRWSKPGTEGENN
jgi:hypothetical protein